MKAEHIKFLTDKIDRLEKEAAAHIHIEENLSVSQRNNEKLKKKYESAAQRYELAVKKLNEKRDENGDLTKRVGLLEGELATARTKLSLFIARDTDQAEIEVLNSIVNHEHDGELPQDAHCQATISFAQTATLPRLQTTQAILLKFSPTSCRPKLLDTYLKVETAISHLEYLQNEAAKAIENLKKDGGEVQYLERFGSFTSPSKEGGFIPPAASTMNHGQEVIAEESNAEDDDDLDTDESEKESLVNPCITTGDLNGKYPLGIFNTDDSLPAAEFNEKNGASDHDDTAAKSPDKTSPQTSPKSAASSNLSSLMSDPTVASNTVLQCNVTPTRPNTSLTAAQLSVSPGKTVNKPFKPPTKITLSNYGKSRKRLYYKAPILYPIQCKTKTPDPNFIFPKILKDQIKIMEAQKKILEGNLPAAVGLAAANNEKSDSPAGLKGSFGFEKIVVDWTDYHKLCGQYKCTINELCTEFLLKTGETFYF